MVGDVLGGVFRVVFGGVEGSSDESEIGGVEE